MSDVKQVKVDNWGVYFLQRLKHFFNRTDYCDLTLQFQDNAQLKVHRLVLNACTEYFEILERTCEMYEDCLIMPDDLQADVVVPIVNFMYTGQLEFKMHLLEKLLQTSQIMNMPVLTKLLDAQKKSNVSSPSFTPLNHLTTSRQSYGRVLNKRPFNKAFDGIPTMPEKRIYIPSKRQIAASEHLKRLKNNSVIHTTLPVLNRSTTAIAERSNRRQISSKPQPTRYEVPEELDDVVYEDSFHNISLESKPLMVHPEASKPSKSKRPDFSLFSDLTASKGTVIYGLEDSNLDGMKCQKLRREESIFEDDFPEVPVVNMSNHKTFLKKDSSQLFDQVFEKNTSPKLTIDSKDAGVDHAKIISEVLKKYPHLVNSNKNIKLKILDSQNKIEKKLIKKHSINEREFKIKEEKPEGEQGNTFEDVLDSQEAAKLIAMGALNVKGPWICLICGLPGKALHFPTYYKFRRHLVEVHKEKPIPSLCEYCGLKSAKRHYALYHLLTKHNVQPPSSYNFPKCNLCSYIALTEAFLVRHKATHQESRQYRCYVCYNTFKSSNQLLHHIQVTGHKYKADRKANLQCIYCNRMFLRENNLYAHLKTGHKKEAKRDGIVDDSEDDEYENIQGSTNVNVKFEAESEEETGEVEYKIQSRGDGNIHLTQTPSKQKILNSGLQRSPTKQVTKAKSTQHNLLKPTKEFIDHNVPSLNTQIHNQIVIGGEYLQMVDNGSEQYYTMDTSENIQEMANSDHSDQELIQQARLIKKPDLPNENQFILPHEPVLFESADNVDKSRLAVLTTLDSDHSNEMMVLPNDYSLTIPQTDGENTNIVVVYSHQVDDQDKQSFILDPQYVSQQQIISTQDIQAHYVESSAVITPNYTTIATTNSLGPIAQTQSLEVITDMSHDPSEVPCIISQSLLQTADQVMYTTVPVSEHENNIANAIESTEMAVVIETDPNFQDSNNGIEDMNENQTNNVELNQQNTEESSNVVRVSIDENVSVPLDEQSEVLMEESQTNIVIETSEIENTIQENIVVPERISEVVSHETTEVQNEENVTEQGTVAINVQIPTQEEIGSPTFTQEVSELSEDHVNASMGDNPKEVDDSITVETSAQTKEQIENLASEWSEDDDETVENHEENDVQQNLDDGIEESIENIQKEIDSQVVYNQNNITQEIIQQSEQNQVTENETTEETTQEVGNINSEPAQEKISTLLNDWEENYSQEETNKSMPVIETTNEGDLPSILEEKESSTDAQLSKELESPEAVMVTPETKPTIPTPIIKTLVSDWDEDEEEKE